MKKNNTWINRTKAKLYRKFKIHVAKKRARKLNGLTRKWKNNDYHFYIMGEYKKHFHVGTKNGFRSACRNYDEWKRCLLVRHKELLDEKNKHNFLRYINQDLRYSKTDEVTAGSVVAPALFAVLPMLIAINVGFSQINASLMATALDEDSGEVAEMLNAYFSVSFNSLFYAMLIATGIYVIVLTVLICSAKNKVAFFEDIKSAFEEDKDI